MKKYLFLVLALFINTSVFAKVKIVTTLPDIAEIAQKIGGPHVEVQTLLRHNEDPHYAEARPDYILKVSRADIVCSMGLELEIGWLPKVLSKSGNAQVQKGATGYCDLGRRIKPLDIPTSLDRAQGHIHAFGNPHFNLSPLKLAEASVEISEVLTARDPKHADEFKINQEQFSLEMQKLHDEIAAKISKGPVLEYHQEFTYFLNEYDIKSLGSLEEKPGLPPSAARLAQVAKLAKEGNAKVLLATRSSPHKILERFQELSGIPFVVLPTHLELQGDSKTITELQKKILKAIP